VQQGVFLHYDRGDHPRLLDAQDPEPFGCNMAFRAELLRKYGLFRTDLGRTGSRLLAGEDTEMFCRLRAAGKPVCYVPDAVVRHPVEAKRLSLGYLVRWQFWGSFAQARAQSVYAGRTLGRVPLYIFRQLMTAGGKCLLYGVRGDRLASAYYLGKLSAGIGSLCGIWFGRSQTGSEKPSLPDKADPSVSPGSLI
jgi:GT2 family glycosyltransferase